MQHNAPLLPMYGYYDVVILSMYLSHMNRGTGIILHLDNRSRVTDMLHSLKWLSVKHRCDLHTPTIVLYTIENELASPYLTYLMYNDTRNHSYETRSSAHEDFSVPNAHLQAKQKDLKYIAEALTSGIIAPLVSEMLPR